MKIHKENINLTKVFENFPEKLDFETFTFLIEAIYPEIEVR